MIDSNMDLQYFADPNSDTSSETNDSEQSSQSLGNEGFNSLGDDSQDTENQAKPEAQEPKLKYTDEDVDKIVQAKLAKETQKREEAVKEAERQAKMTAEQKKDYQLKKAEEEKQQALNELHRFKLMKQVRSELSSNGYNLSDDELSLIVSDDEETTNKNISIMKNMYSKIAQQVKNNLLKGSTPKTSTVYHAVTPEQFEKMSSKEQTELFHKNPEAFKHITGK